jgi:hypothetical protein
MAEVHNRDVGADRNHPLHKQEKTLTMATANGKCQRWSSVASWYIFQPKILIWVNFGGLWNGKCWYILHMASRNIFWSFGIFYGQYGNLVVIWYFTPFG